MGGLDSFNLEFKAFTLGADFTVVNSLSHLHTT